ncbi:MAG TPA: radical SAM family heme chaperone HemW [Frankiaceae bacterium]|nr:radical SAM family heme chaperone HemW [Frankiaceae bacterium]
MPSAPPSGEPAPPDGALPPEALHTLGRNGFGVYVHVPYCAHRCGYCDFNTYVDDTGAAASYAAAAIAEVRLAARVLKDPPPARTVFFGGGTPTLLPPDDLTRILGAIRDELGLAPDAEVTTEANPETLDPPRLAALRAGGINRLSLGMQSAVPHVLDVLERRHTPGRATAVVAEARSAGFDRVSLDLIYGAPGETGDDWRRSLDAVLAADPGHVSAYSLTVEPGTRLHAQVTRGELPAPDDDVLADRYELADDLLAAAGYGWYEISNWARTPADRARHNELYWRDGDWWGVGPGAHSHVGGVRWWNVRLPRDHAAAVEAGRSPAQAREVLDADARRVERVLLGVRLADGHPAAEVDAGTAAELAAEGLLDPDALAGGLLVLTRRGRLLADAVVLRLVG